MGLRDLFDSMFLVPFLTGLGVAILLPILGAFVRLRSEWLGAMGLAHVSAAGVVIAAAFVEPSILIALAAAGLAAAVKALGGRSGNDSYAVMILVGWSLALVGASFSPHGDEVSHALVQGQLYFSGTGHLAGVALLGVASSGLLPWLSPRLLLGQFFPDHFRANGIANPHHDVVFDVFAAVTLAVGTVTIGVMAAFALVFVPPWIVFRFARGWRATLFWSAAVGLVAYLVAFVAALPLDQPFGPVLVLVLLLATPARFIARR
jgi:zinc/manganese transport system permease protein